MPPLSTRELPMARAGQSVGSNGSCTAHKAAYTTCSATTCKATKAGQTAHQSSSGECRVHALTSNTHTMTASKIASAHVQCRTDDLAAVLLTTHQPLRQRVIHATHGWRHKVEIQHNPRYIRRYLQVDQVVPAQLFMCRAAGAQLARPQVHIDTPGTNRARHMTE